jgi:hypothetical protein
MSHPDPLFDADNSYEDDDMEIHDDTADALYDDYHDFHDDSMDGDHDSAMTSCGWGTDEDYGSYGDDIDAFHDYYGEDF